MRTVPTPENNLGTIITRLYEEFLEIYRDEEIASIATASVINDLLWQIEENARADTDQ